MKNMSWSNLDLTPGWCSEPALPPRQDRPRLPGISEVFPPLLLSQEPVLFDRSIAENIAYGDNSREVAIEEVRTSEASFTSSGDRGCPYGQHPRLHSSLASGIQVFLKLSPYIPHPNLGSMKFLGGVKTSETVTKYDNSDYITHTLSCRAVTKYDKGW